MKNLTTLIRDLKCRVGEPNIDSRGEYWVALNPLINKSIACHEWLEFRHYRNDEVNIFFRRRSFIERYIWCLGKGDAIFSAQDILVLLNRSLFDFKIPNRWDISAKDMAKFIGLPTHLKAPDEL